MGLTACDLCYPQGMTSENSLRPVVDLSLDDVVDDAPTPAEALAEQELSDSARLDESYYETADEAVMAPRRSWLSVTLATVAVLAVIGWTAFFGWVHHEAMLAFASPLQWSEWIAAWAVPPALVALLWLLAARSPQREARRFGAVAQSLAAASEDVEARLSIVNRELSVAREFLAAQARDLDALGRVATERLTTHGDHLQALVSDNGAQIDNIATVSAAAVDNMNRLRDDLPVLANSARDVSNQIGTAGRTANAQVGELVAGFARLNEFGQASEQQVESLRARVDAAIAAFETGAETADRQSEHRLAALRDSVSEIGAKMSAQEDAALDRWEERVKTLESTLFGAIETVRAVDEKALNAAREKLDELRREAEAIDSNIEARNARLGAQIAERQDALAKDEQDSVDRMNTRLAALDLALGERHETQLEQAEAVAASSDTIARRMDAASMALSALAATSEDVQRRLDDSTAVIANRLTESNETLGITKEQVESLTEACVRLLELVQASAQHSRDELPGAMVDAEERLSRLHDETRALDSAMQGIGETSEAVSNYVIGAADNSRAAVAEMAALKEQMRESDASRAQELERLRHELMQITEESEGNSARIRSAVTEAIAALSSAASEAPTAIEAALRNNAETFAEKIGVETGDAIERAANEGVRASLVALEEAAARASGSGRETAQQLRDQLAKVDALAGNLETRVARARQLANEQVDNDFARRVALITEALNSSAIDIDKALSEDVSNTAWASYLRGDRGIFTRRAVRLLDNTQARDIAEIYDQDGDFRETVSRYIHDFEAMLREMLSTRDGNTLGVTLLSSDMGKLYVALAQAIERLRD